MVEKTAQKLDTMIEGLLSQTGELGFKVNPDDAWAQLRLEKWEKNSKISVRKCSSEKCSFYLSSFEPRCPLCGFEPPLADQFVLPEAPKLQPKAQAKGGKKGEGKKAGKDAGDAKKAVQAAKKEKKKKTGGASPAGGDKLVLDAFGKAQLCVARVAEISPHPEADGLYAVKLDVGDDKLRSVCAGLRKFYSEEQLKDRLVCAVLNLKPRALKGIMSEAMILAGNNEDGSKVSLLQPASGSKVGDALTLEGVTSKPVPTCNANAWKRIVGEFKVANGKAQVASKDLASSSGAVTVAELPDGSSIH